jgi:hypothetical protein
VEIATGVIQKWREKKRCELIKTYKKMLTFGGALVL